MLIACPECERKVSDRAAACPDCAFPIAEHVAEQRAAQQAEQERTQRSATGTMTDCPPCKGRGFAMEKTGEKDDRGEDRKVFWWCDDCHRGGRLPVAQSPGGYFAVAIDSLDEFVAGNLPADDKTVHALGDEAPAPPSYGPDGTLAKAREAAAEGSDSENS